MLIISISIFGSRYQKAFHGVDLTPLHEEAMQEYFRQPIVDTFDIRICMSKSIKHSVDFLNDKESDLHKIGTVYHIYSPDQSVRRAHLADK